MPGLIELLESFNRKERFFLISQAVGEFQLSHDFGRELAKAIKVDVPHGAFTAMDYHLEWLTAALHAYECGDVDKIFDNPLQQVIKGNQEDADLLVAFEGSGDWHIVLIEAKGATGWTNAQMQSKASRLGQIFGFEGDRYPGVVPHFCLVSPRPPQQLKASAWPRWMSNDDGSYIWFPLKFPGRRRMVTRCTVDGERSADGSHFRIVSP